jgi:hypothetical protein
MAAIIAFHSRRFVSATAIFSACSLACVLDLSRRLLDKVARRTFGISDVKEDSTQWAVNIAILNTQGGRRALQKLSSPTVRPISITIIGHRYEWFRDKTSRLTPDVQVQQTR